MNGHVDEAVLARYAESRLDAASSWLVEAHLPVCAECREGLAAHVAPERLHRIWEDVTDRLDRPALTPTEWVLVRLGVREHTARLVASTPALRRSWLLAVTVVLAFAVAAAYVPGQQPVLFLVLAPLVPLAGVAAAYGPGVDPTYEIGVAAPLDGFRLLLLRALAVLTVAFVLTGGAALTLPGLRWAAAWVLPGLALALLCLALETRWAPAAAATTVAVGWCGILSVIWLVTATAPVTPFRDAGQLAAAMVAGLSLVTLLVRRDRLNWGVPQ